MWPTLSSNLAPPLDAHVIEQVWSCLFCEKTTLRLLVFAASESQDRDPVEVLDAWPRLSPRELHSTVPESVRDLYREGSVCENARAYRGAAGMYRAAVEAVCCDRGVMGGKLYDRIEDLVNRGLSRELVDDLHEARLLGNWSLHDGLEFSAQEVADVAELIQEAVHILYVEPAQRATFREARRERRKAFKPRHSRS
jgi:uncharacterized protein DUF4145